MSTASTRAPLPVSTIGQAAALTGLARHLLPAGVPLLMGSTKA